MERGNRVGEKWMAPAGTIQGMGLTESRPIRTAGSSSSSARASSGVARMMLKPAKLVVE